MLRITGFKQHLYVLCVYVCTHLMYSYVYLSGSTVECDVSLAHPWRKDIIKGAAKGCGHAAATRELQKY